ncbi:MAG: hypothetical protein KGH63_04065 [Candidatus Micrarchaeota archaeon]|nr:hypothetical protein [Candidatus Micrarchaeota archaeon]
MKMTLLIIALLLAGLLVMAGCAGSAPASPSAAAPAQVSAPASLPAPVATPGSMMGGGMMADNKTGYQKTQQSIAAALADGTYPAQVTYYSPGGSEVIDFSVTVQGGVITAASGTPAQADRMAMHYMGNFNSALPSLVVGQKIDQLQIPQNVAGSSLTTAAFAQYVTTLVQSHGAAA